MMLFSEGEEAFAFYWRTLAKDWPEPKREAVLPEDKHNPSHPWTIDFLFPLSRVVVEIEGVSHRLTRYGSDRVKYNKIAIWGYCLLRYTKKDILDDPDRVIAEVKEAIGRKR